MQMTKLYIQIIALFLSFNLFAQKDLEIKGTNLMFQKDFKNAEKVFDELLKTNPKNPIALYGKGRIYFEYEQAKRVAEKNQILYTNFQDYFDLLDKAYVFASKAADAYINSSNEEKDIARKYSSISDLEFRENFSKTILREYFELFTIAPYRKPTYKLYEAQIYDRYQDADTVEALRIALLDQCSHFISTYPNTFYSLKAESYRKELLTEYLSMQELRRFGDRSGSKYEKYCSLIIQHFSASELSHIVGEFYGAEYEFPKENYVSNPNYVKLLNLALKNKTDVINLLCKMNLHEEGYKPSKDKLYTDFIQTLAPSRIAFVAVKSKAAYFINQHNLLEAKKVFETYKTYFPQDSEDFIKLIGLFTITDKRNLKNLGPNINSSKEDYNPVISSDGSTLYFARKNASTGEDIYYSRKDAEGNWSKAEKLSEPINTTTHETPQSISADGNTLLLFGNYSLLKPYFYVFNTEKNLGKGDIYYSNLENNSWGKVDVFPSPINTQYYEATLTMTADNKAVLFCSDRPDSPFPFLPNYNPSHLYHNGSGEFNTDIYVCEKNADGSWGKAINLGKTINTPYAEYNPILHSDMKTLYFASEGHYGIGGYDIFMSKRLDPNSWTEWSKPVNLGLTINSTDNDNFFISMNGKYAYMSSNKSKDTHGKIDIYEIEVPKFARPENVTFVKGKITDTNGTPLETTLKWIEDKNNTNSGTVTSDKSSGEFTINLTPGKKYHIYTDNDDKFSTSYSIDLKKESEVINLKDPIIEGDFSNKTLNSSKAFVMKTLHFDHNSDKIREESLYDLKRFADFLKAHPHLKIAINGHTDSDGDDNFNLKLSERRTESVKNMLVLYGCDKSRLTCKGFGETQPIQSNSTPEGKQINRRVEFVIVY